MNVGFVFTNYNNSEYTIDVVRSLLDSKESDKYKVVIVDNDSSAEDVKTLHELKKEYPEMELICNSKNLGYFRGLNVGIEFLRKGVRSDLDLIIVGNNDLVFPEELFEQLLSARKLYDKYPVISPNLITIDGVHQNPHVREAVSNFREFVWYLYYSNFYVSRLILKVARMTGKVSERKDYTSYQEAGIIYQGYGACYLLTPLFFENFEKLWSPTFLMGEEFFLWKQVNDAAMSIYYEPSILVEHRDHGSVEKVPSRKIWGYSKVAYKKYREMKSPS